MTPDELFDAVAEAHLGDPGVTEGRMFGSPCLKISGKVFACLVKGELVVKLPSARVDELALRGGAARFDPGMGTQMKEWAAVAPRAAEEWVDLSAEARDFVASLL